jgi:hypothetical protein
LRAIDTVDGENWEGEQIDGKPFELEEPNPGEVWTRDDYDLPQEGVLSVRCCHAPEPKSD